jgi:hypothetical protein
MVILTLIFSINVTDLAVGISSIFLLGTIRPTTTMLSRRDATFIGVECFDRLSLDNELHVAAINDSPSEQLRDREVQNGCK